MFYTHCFIYLHLQHYNLGAILIILLVRILSLKEFKKLAYSHTLRL